MKIVGMETNIYEEEPSSPYLTSVKCLGTPREAKYEEHQSKTEEQGSPPPFHTVLLDSELSLSSLSPLLDYKGTSLGRGVVAGCVSAPDQPEPQQLREEFLSSAGHEAKEDPLNLPSCSHWRHERHHEIRVIKHKTSAITFSDFGFLSREANTKLRICEEAEGVDFSFEEEAANGRGDDDMFTELPRYEAYFSNLNHKRNVSERKQDKWEPTKYQRICHLEECSDHSERELRDRDQDKKHTDLETQPGKESEWSDSMSCLMKKLEQLNLDIEEALSADSSPSCTPSAKRHKQLCPVRVESGFYGDQQAKGPWKKRRGGYQDLDLLSYPVSMGARPKTDVLLQKLCREQAVWAAKDS